MNAPYRIIQEADAVAGRRLVLITVVALVITGLAIVVSTLLGGAPRHAAASSSAPPRAKPTLGMVEQTSIEDTERGVSLREAQRARLRQFGWVDRDAGVARIPIERAMELTVERRR
jgi:hypothetical protein